MPSDPAVDPSKELDPSPRHLTCIEPAALRSTAPVHDGVTVAAVPLGKSPVNEHSPARLRQRHISSDLFHPKELPCPTPHETRFPTM